MVVLLTAAVVIVAAALLYLDYTHHRSGGRGVEPGRYRSLKPLSDPEQSLYWRLKEAMPECVVLAQVTFSRFIAAQHSDRSGRQALFNRISRKSEDFLVCLPDFTVVAAVELDDKSHSPKTDAQRDSILEAAGIPLVRVNVREVPSAEQLRAIFTR